MLKRDISYQQFIVRTTQMVIAVGLCVAWLAVSPAHAHFVWIERDEAGPTRMYFDEWANDVREKSSGRLVMFKTLQAFGTSITQSLQFAPRNDHREIAVNDPGNVHALKRVWLLARSKQTA